MCLEIDFYIKDQFYVFSEKQLHKNIIMTRVVCMNAIEMCDLYLNIEMV